MNITDYILLSEEQRRAHIDLSLPCEFGVNRRWAHKRDESLRFFGVTNDSANWLHDNIHRCHACVNDTQAEFICFNPRHWWIGTASENVMGRSLEKRQAGGRATRGISRSPESIMKRARALRGQKRSPEQKKRMSESHKGKFFWVTNGNESAQIRIGSPIPEGWRRGRTIPKRKHETTVDL